MASRERTSLPSELEDDQKAAVLYSPFREKSLNPQSWNRKMKFWENVLSATVIEKNIVAADMNSLPHLFERKGITPKCLATVTEELRRSGRIKTVKDYERTNGWLSWGFNALVKQPLSWGVSQLFGSPKKDATIYVWPEVVKNICEQVLHLYESSIQHEQTENLMSLASLRALCQTLIPVDQHFEIVLTQLERDRKVEILTTSEKEIIIKFCRKGEAQVTPITELELQIYRIQETEKRLEKEIELLSERARGHTAEARSHIREDRKTMAKHCLRKRKAILKRIERKSGSLNMLHDIIQKIEEAGTNEMVIKACQAGADALKSLNAELTVEKAEAAMDEVAEAIENQEDISQALSSVWTSEINDEQYEQELDALLKDALQKEEIDKELQSFSVTKEKEKLMEELDNKTHQSDGLPNVPTHSPSKSGQKGKKKADTTSQSMLSS